MNQVYLSVIASYIVFNYATVVCFKPSLFSFYEKDLIYSVIFFLGGNLQPNIPIENETLVISGGLSEGNL